MAKATAKIVSCRIQYRRCLFDGPNPNGVTLQKLVQKALQHQVGGRKVVSSVGLRLRDMSAEQDGSDINFMNHLRGASKAQTDNIFGDLCRYQAGSIQAMIDKAKDAEELPVTFLEPADKQEFLDSMLWWRISGDHVLAVQGRTVRWNALESYLRWLTSEITNALPVGLDFHLDPTVKATVKGRNQPGVSSVSVSTDIPASYKPASASTSVLKQQSLSSERQGGPALWNMLSAMFPDDKKLSSILKKIPHDEQVTLDITLKFPSRREMPSRISLGSMVDALDAMADAEVMIETDQGRVKLGDLLQRPEHIAKVLSHGGIWDREDVYRALGEAWQAFAGNSFMTG